MRAGCGVFHSSCLHYFRPISRVRREIIYSGTDGQKDTLINVNYCNSSTVRWTRVHSCKLNFVKFSNTVLIRHVYFVPLRAKRNAQVTAAKLPIRAHQLLTNVSRRRDFDSWILNMGDMTGKLERWSLNISER